MTDRDYGSSADSKR